jgi:hypothetical protein
MEKREESAAHRPPQNAEPTGYPWGDDPSTALAAFMVMQADEDMASEPDP